SAKTFAATVTVARHNPRLVTAHTDWDSDIWRFNGQLTIDLRTGRSRPPQPEDLCTKIAAAAPKDMPTPLWSGFLDRVTAGDRELAAYLQRVAGYCLTGVTTEHALFFLYGTGANGKGVFLNT